MEGTYDSRSTYVGTLTYMSPERFEGKPYNSDTDLWSLGILLYELATGEFPFPHIDEEGREVGFFDLLKFILHNPSPTLPQGKFQENFEHFISILLNKEPGKRSSAEALLQHPFMK